ELFGRSGDLSYGPCVRHGRNGAPSRAEEEACHERSPLPRTAGARVALLPVTRRRAAPDARGRRGAPAAGGSRGPARACRRAEPAPGALAVRVDTERAALPPSGGPLHLRVALRSSPARNLARARLSVAVALDVSGSMDGAAIANARAATQALVRRLADDDHFT